PARPAGSSVHGRTTRSHYFGKSGRICVLATQCWRANCFLRLTPVRLAYILLRKRKGLVVPSEITADTLSLLKVGDIARRTGKTVRAIHLYEELGLLNPAVRSKGGFRMYRGDGDKRIERIQKLQDMGFSLTEIKVF